MILPRIDEVNTSDFDLNRLKHCICKGTQLHHNRLDYATTRYLTLNPQDSLIKKELHVKF